MGNSFGRDDTEEGYKLTIYFYIDKKKYSLILQQRPDGVTEAFLTFDAVVPGYVQTDEIENNLRSNNENHPLSGLCMWWKTPSPS